MAAKKKKAAKATGKKERPTSANRHTRWMLEEQERRAAGKTPRHTQRKGR